MNRDRLSLCILAAGAGGMYCGSCLRDNALASALKRRGHDVSLIPLYTPLRTESASAAIPEQFYGGVNVYLQHATRFFRHTPRVIDWLFDRPWLLNLAGKMGSQTSPAKLAGLTVDILHAEEGPATKELHRLVHFLKEHVRPQVVTLPNLMFAGMARVFRQELGVPVVCELTGEDIFLDAMEPADREMVRGVIRERAADVTRFVATSDYYAGRMADYLGIPRESIDVVYTGIAQEYLGPLADRPSLNGHVPTVGYLARICSEKGLANLIDAMDLVRGMPNLSEVRLQIAGYLGGRDQKWFDHLKQRIDSGPLRGAVTFLGEVDQAAKLRMLDSIDVFSVPTVYPEAKGIYVLEALARGVPVVQPAHGAFPELIRLTGGGVLAAPSDPRRLAEALAELLGDAPRRHQLGRAGRAAIESTFTDDHMAENMLRVYRDVIP